MLNSLLRALQPRGPARGIGAPFFHEEMLNFFKRRDPFPPGRSSPRISAATMMFLIRFPPRILIPTCWLLHPTWASASAVGEKNSGGGGWGKRGKWGSKAEVTTICSVSEVKREQIFQLKKKNKSGSMRKGARYMHTAAEIIARLTWLLVIH